MKFIYILLLASASAVSAQNIPDEDVKKKIRDIKLSEKYIYAEASSLDNPTTAKQVAIDKLKTSAVSLMAEDSQEKEKIKEKLNIIDSQQQVLEYNHGKLFKAFACILKDKLISTTKMAQVNEKSVEQPTTAISKAAIPAIPAENENDSLPMPTTLPNSAVVTTNQDSTTLVSADPNMPTESTFNVDANTAALVMEMLSMSDSKHGKAYKSAASQQVTTNTNNSVQTSPADTTKSSTKQSMDTIPEEHLKIINDLLSLDTYESAMLYLNAMKEDGRMMYGPLKKIFMPERAYMLILKDGKIVTVLNKGLKERLNLKTQELESLQKYIGYGIVWFQIYNRPKI